MNSEKLAQKPTVDAEMMATAMGDIDKLPSLLKKLSDHQLSQLETKLIKAESDLEKENGLENPVCWAMSVITGPVVVESIRRMG